MFKERVLFLFFKLNLWHKVQILFAFLLNFLLEFPNEFSLRTFLCITIVFLSTWAEWQCILLEHVDWLLQVLQILNKTKTFVFILKVMGKTYRFMIARKQIHAQIIYRDGQGLFSPVIRVLLEERLVLYSWIGNYQTVTIRAVRRFRW